MSTELATYLRRARHLQAALRLLEWDQEVLMPPAASEARAAQMAELAAIAHARETADELGALIDGGDAADPMVREAKYDFDRKRRVPEELVAERTRKASLGRQAWVEAREKSDFAIFRPHLEGLVDLMRRWADAIGYDDDPYDALLRDFEPGESAQTIDSVLKPVRDNAAALLGRILDAGEGIDDGLLHRKYPVEGQRELARLAAEAVGFDFARGRLDDTVHPFCSALSPNDVRLTTRYDETNMFDSLYSTLHEAGHGMYEQGLPEEEYGNPLGEAAGMAVHESQSRLIENHVARSRAAWTWLFPQVAKRFAEAGDSAEEYYRAVNVVRPNLIRVDADEVTYDLHVVLRYELERAMVAGELDVADLPEAWNAKYGALLRIEPPDDAKGCLQDVHWSAGLFGYFPTYSLGNVYAAQLYEAAERDVGDLPGKFAKGEFAPFVEWMREKVHRHGRRYRPRDLIERATGKAPTAEPMIAYLETKFGKLYGL